LLPRRSDLMDFAVVQTRTSRLLRHLSAAGGPLIVLLIPSALFLATLLMAEHLLTLPKPRVDARFSQSLESALSAHTGPRFAPHVLVSHCQWSNEVLAHLLARDSQTSLSEKELFIGDEELERSRLSQRGFVFASIAPEGLPAKWGLEGAARTLAANPRGKVAASGQDSSTKQGSPQRVATVRDFALETEPTDLSLFICAVSREHKNRLDPLGLKYGGITENRP
jgi:hypothetical protein